MADMRDVLLVDGYNMIGAWPELSALVQSGMQEARDRLLERLADHQAYSGRRVIVVFDAYRVPGLGKTLPRAKSRFILPEKKKLLMSASSD